jgi:ABC-type amino acid transport substrate-binding protein
MKQLMILFSLITLFSVQAQTAIQLAMPNYPPYTEIDNGKLSGFGYDLVVKIMDKAGIKMTVLPAPNYGRALEDTRQGKADGFFLASQNKERDEIAVFSSPVTTSTWLWVTLKDSKIPDFKSPEFKTTAKVGVQLNSNIHKWLTEKGYNIAGTPSDISVLLKMLKSDRVSAILLPELTFKDIVSKEGDKIETFRTGVESTFPFAIYISKSFITRNPDIMKRLNAAIKEVTGN